MLNVLRIDVVHFSWLWIYCNEKVRSYFWNDLSKLHVQFPVDGLVEVRKELKGLAKERGIKLSYMPFFVKVWRENLIHFYTFNST